MFAIPGLLGLIFLTYVRPQAFIAELRGVPLIHLVYVLAVVGFAIDLRTRLLRAQVAPLLWWAIAYFGWCLFTVAIMNPSDVMSQVTIVTIRFLLFFMTAQAVQSFRSLRAAIVMVLLIAGFLSVVGIHQGLAPYGCIQFKSDYAGAWDGRPCVLAEECYHEGEPGALYRCERVGLFDTHSVNGRVRWLGIIEDPNELAMCVSLCVPLLLGLFLLRPRWANGIVLVLGASAYVACTVFTQSRGGQLVFLAAMGIYFVRRYGWKGALAMVIVAAPVLLLGGRSGGEADQSKLERLEALYTATDLIRARPLVGVGFGQFLNYHVRTAHNSYALAGAEMGLPGLFLFLACLYQSLRGFVLVTSRTSDRGPERPAYVWAGALMAAQGGLMIGIFFLSFNSSPILWTFMGLCAGFQLAVLRHDPRYDFSLRRRDFLYVGALTIAVFVFMFVYSHLKAGAAA